MSEDYGYSRRRQRWLDRFGFISDPFELYEADQERACLPFFFVDRPYLQAVLGDPAHPQAAFLIAGRGGGKTATREMVAYECEHGRLRRHALAVRYDDFSLLLGQAHGDLAQLNVRHHVRAIVRFTLKALAQDVPPTYFDLLGETERCLLMGYAAGFADPVSCLKLGQIIPGEPIHLDWDALSPRETLEMLTKLVAQLGQSPEAGYQAVYVLVDRVDETSAGQEAAVALLKPLVSEGPLLEMAHFALKFFLPVEVGAQLRQSVALRPDRLRIAIVDWDEKALREVVQQRLLYYSRSRIEHLEQLCTSGAKTSVMERLIEACGNSPRTLLRLGGALIRHHVDRTDDALIDWKDISATLSDFAQQMEIECTRPSLMPATSTVPAMPVTPPERGLYLDENGHVWIDGELLTPPLSELEFRLLKTLYRQAPKVVSREALIEAVWHSPPLKAAGTPDDGERALHKLHSADEQNLRKLIDRLRDRLKTTTQGQRSRFIRNVRGRGYWFKMD